MENYPENWPQFFTATINGWKYLLEDDCYKDIVIDCIRHLIKGKQIRLNGFVIMSNHIHLIWQAMHGYHLKKIQDNFLKITAKKFKDKLISSGKVEVYEVNAADRKYNFWKRDSLGVELFTPAVFQQKLDYIHQNPVKAGLCNFPEEYRYSSAAFYYNGVDTFGIMGA